MKIPAPLAAVRWGDRPDLETLTAKEIRRLIGPESREGEASAGGMHYGHPADADLTVTQARREPRPPVLCSNVFFCSQFSAKSLGTAETMAEKWWAEK
jgi:hypothetical protein